jgi:hypothetical protein
MDGGASTTHDMAVTLEHGLRNLGFLSGGWTIEPPDSEDEPDNFGVAYNGELLFVVQVVAW